MEFTPQQIKEIRDKVTHIRALKEKQENMLRVLEFQIKVAELGYNPSKIKSINQKKRYVSGVGVMYTGHVDALVTVSYTHLTLPTSDLV